MDPFALDRLTRAFATAGTRRRLLALLGVLPLASTLPQAEVVEAAGRRRRHKRRHHPGGDKRHRKGKQKGQDKGKNKAREHKQPQPTPPSPPCVPQPQTTTCAGQCATVTNNCGTAVDCGPCACTPPCPQCQTCDETTGTCQPEADDTPCDDGDACTQTDTCQGGLCVGSDPVVCAASDPCHVAGRCDPQTGMCDDPPAPDGTACDDHNACTTNDQCQGGVCTGTVVTCPADACHIPGTCDPQSGTCSAPTPKTDGTSCGGGQVCCGGSCVGCCGDGNCPNDRPVCQNHSCVAPACTSTADCPANTLCDGGTCQRCDVTCPSGTCSGTVRSYLNAHLAQQVVRICPGTYLENLSFESARTLIGAGDGTGPGDTILQGGAPSSGANRVVYLFTSLPVSLRSLRITGGDIYGGGGIYNTHGPLTLTDCTVSGNTATLSWGGGIYNERGSITLDHTTVTGNSAVTAGGGIFSQSPSTVTLQNGSSVSGNSAPAEPNCGGTGTYTDPEGACAP